MIDFETPLADRAQSAISSSPYLAGRQVWLETSDGRIVLQGVVGTFFQKQMAQEALRRVDGVRQIENNLEVAWS
jgi:osmotically-inducible protein OsmY